MLKMSLKLCILVSLSLIATICHPVFADSYGIAYNPGKSMDSGYVNMETILNITDFIQNKLKPTSSATGNLVLYLTIQAPLEIYMNLFRHEYYGHGARQREFGVEGNYNIDFKWPISQNGWSSLSHSPSNIDEEILATVAGVESGTWYAYKTQKLLLSNPEKYYNNFLYYFLSKTDLYFYAMRSTHMTFMGYANNQGDDIDAYYNSLISKYYSDETKRIKIYNTYKYTHTLQTQTLYGQIDLLFLMSMKAYELLDKARTGEQYDYNWLPTPLFIFNTRVLPGTRVGLTPWGIEYYFDLYLLQNDKSINTIYLRRGDNLLEDFWGIGFDVEGVKVSDRFSVGIGVDIFNQPLKSLPQSETGYSVRPIGNETGGNVYVAPSWTLFSNDKTDLVLSGKLAYKTKGYLMGQPYYDGGYGFIMLSLAH